MLAVSDFRPLELWIAAEYRRCAVYAAIGWFVYSAIVVWQKVEGFFNQPWDGTIAILGFMAAIVFVPAALIFRYRLWIDETGLWRRRLIGRDLWPWEAFEHGLVRPSKAIDQLTFPAKSWYWRTISTRYLGKPDRAAFDAAIGRFWTPPPPLPEAAAVSASQPLKPANTFRERFHQPGQVVPGARREPAFKFAWIAATRDCLIP